MLKEKIIYLPIGILTLVTASAGVALSVLDASAATSATVPTTVTVTSACTMSSSGGTSHSATVANNANSNLAGVVLTANCNDSGGYAVYAVGYYNGAVSTALTSDESTIATGTSGSSSYWGFYVSATGNASIATGYNNLSVVPSSYTKVAYYNPSTVPSAISTGTVATHYTVHVAPTQAAGSYTGGVKYMMVHPYSTAAPSA